MVAQELHLLSQVLLLHMLVAVVAAGILVVRLRPAGQVAAGLVVSVVVVLVPELQIQVVVVVALATLTL